MQQATQVVQLAIRPAAMNLFPTMGSLREVHEWAESQLPISSKNQVTALLAVYHNTLLKQLSN